MSKGSIPKFGVYGVPVTHASLMLDVCPDDTILLGPKTRSLLPAMYKVKEFKEVEGVGLAHVLMVSNHFDKVGFQHFLYHLPTTYLPTHINFTLLFLWPLWSDLGL